MLPTIDLEKMQEVINQRIEILQAIVKHNVRSIKGKFSGAQLVAWRVEGRTILDAAAHYNYLEGFKIFLACGLFRTALEGAAAEARKTMLSEYAVGGDFWSYFKPLVVAYH